MSVVIPAKDLNERKQLDDGPENVKATMLYKLVSTLIFIKIVPVHLSETGKVKLICCTYSIMYNT